MHLLPRTLGGKLVGIVGLVVVCTVGAGFAFVAATQARVIRRDMVERTVVVAKLISEHAVSDLAFEDPQAATETLTTLAGVPAIEYACLRNADGALFAAYGQGAGQVGPAGHEASVTRVGHTLLLVQPVALEGRVFGSLFVRASTRELEAIILRQVAALGALAAVLIALALLLTTRLQRIVTGPILELEGTMRRVSATGDHSLRATAHGSDEVASLCTGLNTMLDTIQAREQERDEALLRTREKSQFLAAMSHELRTPLNSIIGFAEILLSRSGDSLDARQRKFLNNIYRSGQHLLGIINDILDLSKVEAGKMELHTEPVSVSAILDGVAAVMKGAADKRQVEIRVEVPIDLPLVLADPVKIKQVFFNLLSNAVKFSPEQSTVRVTGRHLPAAASTLGEESVVVDVVDRGIGIAEEYRDKIFQPFRQADSGVGRRFEGTGLGLSLARAFVENHGGKILLASEVGVGSTFTVVLPCRLQKDGELGTVRAQRILVVGGNRLTQDRIRRDLVAGGFEVMSADQRQEAMELVRQLVPAAVVVDVMLPDVEGWETLAELKTHRKTAGAPVVLYSVADEREMGLVLGLDDYFVKPDGLDRLAARVEQIVQTRGGSRTRVLVVDEETAVYELLHARLSPFLLRVEHCTSCDQALAQAVASPPAVAVLDLRMEGWSGFRTAVRLRSLPKTSSLPIVVATAAELTLEDRRLLDARISELVQQGEVERQPLVEIVRRLLARRQAYS